MCGRFAQYSSRDDYFESIGLKTDEITFDPEPLGRYNVAPGTKVLLTLTPYVIHSETEFRIRVTLPRGPVLQKTSEYKGKYITAGLFYKHQY